MKRLFIPLCCIILAAELSGCLNTEKEMGSSSAEPHATYMPPNPKERSSLTSQTVLNTVTATHAFSDPKQADRFVLQLRGPRVLTGRAHLIVLNSAGDTLRHEVMPARALLDEQALADPQAATVRDKEVAILRGMNHFFDASHFTSPAVGKAAPLPAEVDQATWQALQAEPKAVGFDFPGSGGAMKRLAFVQSEKKAVVLPL